MGWPFDGPILPWEIAEQTADNMVAMLMFFALAIILCIAGLLFISGRLNIGPLFVSKFAGVMMFLAGIMILAGVIEP